VGRLVRWYRRKHRKPRYYKSVDTGDKHDRVAWSVIRRDPDGIIKVLDYGVYKPKEDGSGYEEVSLLRKQQ